MSTTELDHQAPPHPAKFSPSIIRVLRYVIEEERSRLGRPIRVLDPFAGVGGIHAIRREPDILTLGVELEPEWAFASEHTIVGDATNLPEFMHGHFDVVATSPAYGNRMADNYDGRDGSKRQTYRIALGRELSDGSAAGLQWGDRYRDLHRKAWHETDRCLKPGGLFVLNIKDHIRDGVDQGVPGWHYGVLVTLGYEFVERHYVDTPHMGFGSNAYLRCPEEVYLFRKPE